MSDPTFNLTTQPWLKVIDKNNNQERTISLIELFKNAQDYRQLSGDMHVQDLAILRFLLAILLTVYSRFKVDGSPYDWLKVDPKTFKATSLDSESDPDDLNDDLFDTWQTLYQNGHFSEIVTRYLTKYADRFDLFGDHPFYQVTASDYDAFVPKKKWVMTGKGTVAVKQVNRQISESGNSVALFSPSSDEYKNQISLAALTRWLITYQNFTGTTDKTKIETAEKFSTPAGWLYKLNPVFASGNDLFQTLMLNLTLASGHYSFQKPVWEYESIETYLSERKKTIQPDDLAALYTTWSRLMHIEWHESQPQIFSAGIPMFDSDGAFIEPMTTWKQDKKTHIWHPAMKRLATLNIAMWRNFGQYVNVNGSDDIHQPGIVSWLNELKDRDLIPYDTLLNLTSVAFVSDGNATSQLPVAEVYDDMRINASVLFDTEHDASYWPERIADTIELTQQIGRDYWQFANSIGQIRDSVNSKAFANQMTAKFYDRLNVPFKEWLASLSNQEERDPKINLWKRALKRIVIASSKEVMASSSPREIKGRLDSEHVVNVFTVNNRLRRNLQIHLGLKKE